MFRSEFTSIGNRLVGPLNVRDTIKPLPPDLDEFVSNSRGHGFIIVSFGSNVASILPRDLVDMLATAFGKLKQLVVWRLKGILLFTASYLSFILFQLHMRLSPIRFVIVYV